MYDGAGSSILLAAEPSDVADAGVRRGAREYRRLLHHVLDAVEGTLSATAARQAIVDAFLRFDLEPLQQSLQLAQLRAIVLGADDSHRELLTDEVDEPDEFARSGAPLLLRSEEDVKARVRIGTHLDPVRPWPEVLRDFLSREALTKEHWLSIENAEKLRSFTVARQSSAAAVRRIQESVGQAMSEGMSPAKAAKAIRKVAPDMAKSHAELVYRNAVQQSYSKGRYEHMTQPLVMRLRPWWQTLAVGDARTRETHQAVHRWVMRADDPGWQQTAPPYGHNCRCRLVCRSDAWVKKNAPHIHTGPLPRLPDPGWVTMAPPGLAA